MDSARLRQDAFPRTESWRAQSSKLTGALALIKVPRQLIFSLFTILSRSLFLKKVRKSVKHSREWLLWTTLWSKVKDVRGTHWLQLRGRSQDRSRSLQLQRRFQRHQPLQRRPRLVRLGQNGFSGRWHRCCEDYHLHHLLAGVRTGSRWELTSPVPHDLKENVEKVLHQPFRD